MREDLTALFRLVPPLHDLRPEAAARPSRSRAAPVTRRITVAHGCSLIHEKSMSNEPGHGEEEVEVDEGAREHEEDLLHARSRRACRRTSPTRSPSSASRTSRSCRGSRAGCCSSRRRPRRRRTPASSAPRSFRTRSGGSRTRRYAVAVVCTVTATTAAMMYSIEMLVSVSQRSLNQPRMSHPTMCRERSAADHEPDDDQDPADGVAPLGRCGGVTHRSPIRRVHARPILSRWASSRMVPGD